jgi:hypothetical protein
MNESIKGIADKLLGANPSPKELTLEEMLQYRTKSKQMLENRINSGKRKSSGGQGKPNLQEIDIPCPKCGISNWNKFPDNRKYCLECGAIKETDGTVTGGAIETKTQIAGDKNRETIICEFTCSKCPEVLQVKGKDIETARKKVVPHKAYNPNSQCDGVLTFSGQVSSEVQIVSVPETKEAEKRSIEPETVIYRIKCRNPKRDKFICNRCPDLNDCDQSYEDTVDCLLISIDMKLKKLLERMH